VKILPVIALSAALAVSGCKTTATLPPNTGAVDIVDYTANEILQPAHAFALALSTAVQSTDPNIHIELTAAQKNVLIALNKSLNIADALEIAYHASPSTAQASQLTAAANQVQENLASAQSIINVSIPAVAAAAKK
jgi:hypothetical protein